MFFRMLKKDFFRKKSIFIALFIFIMLSALLVSCGSNFIIELSKSLDYLFTKSQIPHFVQMHSGELNKSEIDKFAVNNELVKKYQVTEMIDVEGKNIFLGSNIKSEENSVMDASFVKQNKDFDLLLNLDSNILNISKGKIGVPIYYMQQNKLKIGDKVRVLNGNFEMKFIISDFIRDAEMNPSVVSSKRFVVNEEDFEILKKSIGKMEYLIEFQLKDLSKVREFSDDYQNSKLPAKGPAVDYGTFKVLNALTDGVVIVVVMLISLLLILIAMLCLRFTFLATIEEDYREIGVMKAIGINDKDIKRVYLSKYVIISALACITGYVVSLFLNSIFTSNILLYLGKAPKSFLQYITPILGAALVFFIIVFFCKIILRRFNKITAMDALRSGSIGETKNSRNLLVLNKSRRFNTNIFLGIMDVIGRFKIYGLLLFIFFISTFIVIVPVNLLNTIKSSDFVSYLGLGKCDIRIDLQPTDNMSKRFNDIITYIQNDKDVEKFVPLTTCRFKVMDNEGVLKNINIESGNFSLFPLKYLSGTAPLNDKDVALSYLNAKDLNKSIGDKVVIVLDGKEKEMKVSGIYQDITNGGKTAKALSLYDADTIIWSVMNIKLNLGVDINKKISEYSKQFNPAKATDLQVYLSQTLGGLTKQLKLITIISISIAIFVSILITALFFKMLIAKDSAQIAIMKSLGFSFNNLRTQYLTRSILVLTIGIVFGTVFSKIVGESLVSILMSFMGASKIEFKINPAIAYGLCPLILMVVVIITTIISIGDIKKSNIADKIRE